MLRTTLALLAAGALCGQHITQSEREAAVVRLESSRAAFLETVARLSDTQWDFKPAPDRWSAGECAEHIVITEGVYWRTLSKLLEAPPSRMKAELSDAELLRLYTDRSLTRVAGEAVQPKGSLRNRAELTGQFNRTRDRIVALARSTQLPLREYVTKAAAGGKLMDGYQWFLRIAGHSERHTDQMREVMAHPDFPKK
ncbi:MAG: DinB family protein [Acidobacteria bacterium]|nr:DinB family protein [Acidobacteriota bacterium]